MRKVTAVVDFFDIKPKVDRKAGESWEVENKRARGLQRAGLVTEDIDLQVIS